MKSGLIGVGNRRGKLLLGSPWQLGEDSSKAAWAGVGKSIADAATRATESGHANIGTSLLEGGVLTEQGSLLGMNWELVIS